VLLAHVTPESENSSPVAAVPMRVNSPCFFHDDDELNEGRIAQTSRVEEQFDPENI
jgi:hypothetical protein